MIADLIYLSTDPERDIERRDVQMVMCGLPITQQTAEYTGRHLLTFVREPTPSSNRIE